MTAMHTSVSSIFFNSTKFSMYECNAHICFLYFPKYWDITATSSLSAASRRRTGDGGAAATGHPRTYRWCHLNEKRIQNHMVAAEWDIGRWNHVGKHVPWRCSSANSPNGAMGS
jgi:hypothetical protein